MYCLELIKFDVYNSYYVEVENVALLQDVVWSCTMVLGGHRKSWKSGKKLGKEGGNPVLTYLLCIALLVWYIFCVALVCILYMFDLSLGCSGLAVSTSAGD